MCYFSFAKFNHAQVHLIMFSKIFLKQVLHVVCCIISIFFCNKHFHIYSACMAGVLQEQLPLNSWAAKGVRVSLNKDSLITDKISEHTPPPTPTIILYIVHAHKSPSFHKKMKKKKTQKSNCL